MKRSIRDKAEQYCYIRRNADAFLLHGIALRDGRTGTRFQVWKTPGSFDMARRFSSLDNAIRYATDNHIAGVSVIDIAGRVLCLISATGEVNRSA